MNGRWKQNCHLVGDQDGNALIVDPGSDAEAISESLDRRAWLPIAIINTHAHYDHVGAVTALVERFRIPFYLHGDDADLLRRANLYRMVFDSPETIRVPEITHDLRDLSGELKIGCFQLDVLHTPGHTPGSVCFRLGNYLFSGDTLMASGAGRTDLPGGDSGALRQSLDVLSSLDAKHELFGGHGRSVALGQALAAAIRADENA